MDNDVALEPIDDQGSRRVAFTCNGIRVIVMDSVSFALPADRGHVIVTGSHGGASAGEYAARILPLITVSSDAGFGKRDAGIRGMAALDAHDAAALCVSHASSRIGDGENLWAEGIISYANKTASALGFSIGTRLQDEIIAYLERRGA